MAKATTLPGEEQILVNIDDLSMMKNIKQAISQLKGVGKIVMPRRKRLSRYEQAMLDVKEGRVYEYDSVDDFFKEMGL